jgi:hypothetical protein
MKTRLLIALGVVILLLGGCGDGDDDSGGELRQVPRWTTIEETLQRPVVETNPFDPAEVAVSGEFRAPSGEVITMPGFVTRAYQRRLEGGREVLTADGELQWAIRFTPPTEGRWSWRWRVETSSGVEVGHWTDFAVTAAAPGGHGFIRRSRRDPRYLELDDGQPFWAVGENLSWYDARGTFAYDEWMARLAAQGCNYIRLWMPSWAFGLEWIRRDGSGAVRETSLGNYAARLDRAWQLDYVLALAQRHGMFVMLSIQNHGAFSLTSNSEWADNPYNAANGGPLQHPQEFFTDEQALDLFKRRLRYIVARWGASPNILAWELWNEVDLAESPGLPALVAWHEDMAATLRALDPNRHLITTSTSGGALRSLYAIDAIDLAQLHFYAFEGVNAVFTDVLPPAVARLAASGKPVLIGEAGVDFRGPAETLAVDPDADGLHDIIWSGLISGSFGSGMTWWWDNVIDPENLYFHFGPLADLTRGVDFASEGFVASRPAATAGERTLSAFALQGASTILVWVKNPNHQYFAPDPSTVEGAVMVLDAVPPGTWEATWLDTRSGLTLPGGAVDAAAGRVMLAAPTFTRDVALRMVRRP